MPPFARSQVGDSGRLGLARLALDVASRVSGVAGMDPGPHGLCVTADPPAGVLRGVSVIAQADGRYEVDLCLIARMVPLLALSEEIRRQLRSRAEREGLAAELGTVNVQFAGALSPGEMLVEPGGLDEAPSAGAPRALGSPDEAQGAEASPTPAAAPGSPPDSAGSGVAAEPPFREPRP